MKTPPHFNNDLSKSELVIKKDVSLGYNDLLVGLIDICGHTHIQAEQCYFLISNKGEYSVKMGDRISLESIQMEFTNMGIKSFIKN